MSLPIGRGSMRVRSCGLVRKRDGTVMAVKERDPEEREIGARFIGGLPNHDSRRAQLSHGE
jgi:hypothetical protein